MSTQPSLSLGNKKVNNPIVIQPHTPPVPDKKLKMLIRLSFAFALLIVSLVGNVLIFVIGGGFIGLLGMSSTSSASTGVNLLILLLVFEVIYVLVYAKLVALLTKVNYLFCIVAMFVLLVIFEIIFSDSQRVKSEKRQEIEYQNQSVHQQNVDKVRSGEVTLDLTSADFFIGQAEYNYIFYINIHYNISEPILKDYLEDYYIAYLEIQSTSDLEKYGCELVRYHDDPARQKMTNSTMSNEQFLRYEWKFSKSCLIEELIPILESSTIRINRGNTNVDGVVEVEVFNITNLNKQPDQDWITPIP